MNATPFLLVAVGLTLSLSSPLPAAENNDLFDRLDKNQDGVLAADELKPDKKRLFDRLVRTSDKNRDGRLSAEEFHDGISPQVEQASLANTLAPQQRPGQFRPDARTLFDRFDRDRDGKLAKPEVPERIQNSFERIDTDNSGFIERPELGRLMAAFDRSSDTNAGPGKRPGLRRDGAQGRPDQIKRPEQVRRPGQPRPISRPEAAGQSLPRLIAVMDRNGDQKISREEASPRLQARFRQIDANDDGQLDAKELGRVIAKMRTGSIQKSE